MTAPTQTDWIEWYGGKCPVAEGVEVDVRHRDGEEYFGHFALFCSGDSFAAEDWTHTGEPEDIVAYRIVRP